VCKLNGDKKCANGTEIKTANETEIKSVGIY